MHLADFDYYLPEGHIARYPLPVRSASRLLCLNRETGEVNHQQFTDLVSLLSSRDLLVCNNSRVIPARLMGQKATGGRVEVLVERILDRRRILAQVRASKSPKQGTELIFADNTQMKVVKRHDDLYELALLPLLELSLNPLNQTKSILEIIEAIGQIPLPPYFERAPEASDEERYQTVYAKTKGSVAAPTAGLHFDEALLNQLSEKSIEIGFVTLHVGAGTFASVRVEDIKQHRMHAEYIEVSEALCHQIQRTKERGGRVIAVGTTTVRSLETASRSGVLEPFFGDTDIFIYPGFQFQCIDGLITNFHLPRSTLLMLICAWAGHDKAMEAYQIAVKQGYRFFSYGDAMWIS